MPRRFKIGDEVRVRPGSSPNDSHGAVTVKGLLLEEGRPAIVYGIGDAEYWTYEDDCDLVNWKEHISR